MNNDETDEESTDDETVEPDTGRKIMVLIDHHKATDKAFREALKNLKPEDHLYFLNVSSNWDYLNEEKNSGTMALAEYSGYCESLGIPSKVIQVEAGDVRKEVLHQIESRQIQIFYCARETLAYPHPETNGIFSIFSSLKKSGNGYCCELCGEIFG